MCAAEESLPPSEYSLEDKFYACVEIIQNMPKSGPLNPTIAEKLKMYSLFKQVTEGPCNTGQPGFWNVIERYKWDAWNQLGDLDREEAMHIYVNFVLDKIDYCAKNWNWDEMMSRYSDDYEKMGPILRIKFRIIDRELIKEDGTRVGHPGSETTEKNTKDKASSHRRNSKAESIKRADSRMSEVTIQPELVHSENRSNSRSSSYSFNDSGKHSSSRERKLSSACARIDGELRAINATLNALSIAAEARHKAFIKIIKGSAIYIAVPSQLSWRSHFFLLLWPFIVHWAIKYFRQLSRVVFGYLH